MNFQVNNNVFAKDCSSCGQSFMCKANDIQDCDCRKIQLNYEETEYIFKKYGTCICNSCLLKLKEEFSSSLKK